MYSVEIHKNPDYKKMNKWKTDTDLNYRFDSSFLFHLFPFDMDKNLHSFLKETFYILYTIKDPG